MRALLPLLLVLTLAAGCGDPPAAPTPPLGPLTVTETFSGTVAVGGSRFYSFVVLPAGTVSLMFGSLTPAGADTPMATQMAIGIGFPQGTGCTVSSSTLLSPGLTYQSTVSLGEGTYCVNIADAGNLSGPADFAIRIVQNPKETAPGDPGTTLFFSDLTVGGVATRTFQATTAGTVRLRLEQLGPPADVTATIGLGLPQSDARGGCNVAVATVAAAPAEISVPVAAGTYCAKIADAGSFTGATTFTINIVRP
ncbi:MAG TPA: hypothetical protein VMM93_06155 [Vicinamibacterales bacterium]|nr:hypothetical protein [Vicinamibacterales bacterium]